MNKIIRYIIIQILFIQNLCEILFNFQRNKTKYTSSKNDTEIFTYLSENFLFTNIKLGTPYQEIPLRISTEYNGLNILSKSAMDKLISFDQSNSSSYYNISEEIEGNLEFFNKIILSKETFNFNNTIIANNLSFVLGVSNNKNYSGTIGLRKISNSKDNITIIEELKKSNYIKNKVFQLKYNNISEESGILIVGNENYSKSDSNFTFEKIPTISLELTWGFTLLKITSGKDEISKEEINAKLNFDNGLILGSNSYNNSIYLKFFKDKLNSSLCETIIINDLLHYTCKKEVNIREFPNLVFNSKESNLQFNLTYEDLFIELNEKYFFLINFKYTNKSELIEFWDFGSPFLKKYSFICDRDNNIIGFYNNKTNQKNDFPYFMIIIIIFGVVIISLLVYILYYILNKKEKKKAHELSEDVTNEKLI